MKEIYCISLLLLASITIYAQGFEVKNLDVDITINKDASFDVVENYEVNFTESKHGLLRDIITQYDFKDEHGAISKRKIYIFNIDVPGKIFTTNELFGKLWKNQLQIKIGDKNELINGAQHYEIKYRVHNALIFNNDDVEFYWNIKSAEWMSVFDTIKFNIHVPEGVALSKESCFVYSGNTGNTEPSSEFTYAYGTNTFSGKSTGFFASLPGQNVTALIKMPKDIVPAVAYTPPALLPKNWYWYLTAFVAAVIFFFRFRFRQNRGTIVTRYYSPQGIDPAMAGALIDYVDLKDTLSLLPYWATKGIISMEAMEAGERSLKGYLKLVKLKGLPEDSAGYEFNLFDKIFKKGVTEVRTDELHNVFQEPFQLLNKASKKYFVNGKSSIKIVVAILSVLWAFFGITGLPFLLRTYVDVDSGKFIAFTIIHFLFFFLIFPFLFAAFYNLLRRKTGEGKRVMGELLGFYQFIKLAEADRLKVLLKEDPLYFEKTMPYAMAFRMLKEWSAKFEGLLEQTPGWYSSASGTKFSWTTFHTSFAQSMATVSTTAFVSSSGSSSSRSSSGGGSSGGGFGGGGGGSW